MGGMVRALFHLLAPAAHAQGHITIDTGIRATFPQVMTAIVNFLAGSALAVCTAIFLVGALMMVGYAAKPDKAEQGKKIMIDSLVGLAIILGSYGILRTVFYLLLG